MYNLWLCLPRTGVLTRGTLLQGENLTNTAIDVKKDFKNVKNVKSDKNKNCKR